MITKKINYKLHNNLKVIIQEYMNLNDGTSHRDHTIQDLRNWIAYTKEGYTNLSQDKVKKLHEEKKEYYRLLGANNGGERKDFRSNCEIINREIETNILGYIKSKKNRENNLLNN